MSESVKEVRAVQNKLDLLPDSQAQRLLKVNCEHLSWKNKGFQTMCEISTVLEGIHVGEIDGVSVRDIPFFNYARLTSCDVERSFSQCTAFFRDNRHAFVMDKLEMTFVDHCNSETASSN